MNELVKKVFCYRDYPSHKTGSGRIERGVRLCPNVDIELSRKETEELLNLVVKGLVMEEKFYD